MYSQSDINDAVEGGALTEEQANSLRGFIARRNGAPTGDEEYFRFILGFNDLFVTIACIFALIAVGWLGSLIPIGGGRGMGPIPIQAPFAALFVAAASWGLAEIFTKKRHSGLPSLVLTISFAWGVALFLVLLLASSGGMGREGGAIIGAVSFGAAAGAAFLHWKRFGVPIAIATVAGFILMAVLTLLSIGMGSMEAVMLVMLIAGLGVFLWAMWWDGQDPRSYSAKSDVAFWLHWLAGVLIVSSLAKLFGVDNGVDSAGGAIVVLLVYLLFALIALVVNRKAYLIIGLSPLIPAIQSLVGGSSNPYSAYDRYGSSSYGSSYGGRSYGSSYPSSYSGGSSSVEATMISILIVGAILVALAIYWAPVRRAIVGMLPENLRARLPATGAEPTEQATTFE